MYFKKAAKRYKEAEVWEKYVQAYNKLGENYIYLSKYDSALPYSNEALTIAYQYLSKEHPHLAASYNVIGSFHFYNGDYDQALLYFKKGLEILVKALPSLHPEVARSYGNLGSAYEQKGDYDQALDYCKKALEIRLEVLDLAHSDLGESYNNIGSAYWFKGDNERALSYHRQALENFIKNLGLIHPYVSISYNNIGNAYTSSGDYEQALFYLQKAMETWTKLLGSSHPYIALCYNNIGGVYIEKENYNEALYNFQKALEIQIKIFGSTHPAIARSYNNIGNIYRYKGNYKQASFYHEKALEMWIKTLGSLHPDVAMSSINLGATYSKIENWQLVLENYQYALMALATDFSNSDIYANPVLKKINSRPVLLETLNSKALALVAHYEEDSNNLKDLEFSLETYQLATQLIDTMRYEHTTIGAQKDLNANSRSVYEGGIRVAHQLYEVTGDTTYLHQAFALAEKSKAFLLQQALKEADALQFANIPDSLLQREKDLKIDLAFYEKKTFEAEQKKDTAKLTMYQNYLFERTQQFDSLIQGLETNYPQYYELKYAVNILTVAEVQGALPDAHTTLVQYMVTDSTSYAFVIGKEQFQVVPLPTDSTLEASISTLRASMMEATYDPRQYTQTAHQLWQQLLQPLDSVITALEGQTPRLVIVPDGTLHYVPFDALLTQPVDTVSEVDFSSLPYAIQQYSISCAPSAALWLKSLQHTEKMTSGTLAFAPEYTGGDSNVRSGSFGLLRSGSLSNLPGAQEEVNALANYTDGNFFFGEEATEANFKQFAPKASVIHLAMHGLVDTEYPENSRLVFTHSGDSIQDDSLHVYELYNMQLPTELVVLSACNTGNGKLLKGEGVTSLARAFMYAGSPNLVMSLWEASDESTPKLMDAFYAGLSKGLSKDEALRQAKLQYIKSEDSRPFFWAAMVPIGNMEPIVLKKQSSWWWIWGLLGVMAVGGVIVWRQRKRTGAHL